MKWLADGFDLSVFNNFTHQGVVAWLLSLLALTLVIVLAIMIFYRLTAAPKTPKNEFPDYHALVKALRLTRAERDLLDAMKDALDLRNPLTLFVRRSLWEEFLKSSGNAKKKAQAELLMARIFPPK